MVLFSDVYAIPDGLLCVDFLAALVHADDMERPLLGR